MNREIKNRDTGVIIYAGEFESMKAAVEQAVASGINVVVTVTFSLAVAGTSIRCNGAVLDLAGPAVIP